MNRVAYVTNGTHSLANFFLAVCFFWWGPRSAVIIIIAAACCDNRPEKSAPVVAFSITIINTYNVILQFNWRRDSLAALDSGAFLFFTHRVSVCSLITATHTLGFLLLVGSVD